MDFVDREISCLDCGQPFVFTAGEQEFYDRKGFKEEPKRCKPCRDLRKTRRTGQLTEGVSRGNGGPPPRSNGNGNGNGNFVAPPDDDDDNIGNRMPGARAGAPRSPRVAVQELRTARPRMEREMFDAVCAQCGTATRVPFRPVAGRPVYCRDCYGARRGVGD